MKPVRILICSCFGVALIATVPGHAAKQDETEGMAGMSGEARQIYQKTDKKAAQRPGQTVVPQPIAPIKGEKGENRTTKGEETAGTAPASSGGK